MAQIDGYELPDDLSYTEDHAWLKVEPDGRVRLGWTDFAQQLAGELSFVKVPKVGRAIKKGKVLFSVQSGKWAGKIKSPVDGTVAEANDALVYEPKTINDDCYGAGWVAVIEPSNLETDLQGMIPPGEKAAEWLRQEITLHVADGK
jgi:glycine cleavage system H protein